MTTAARERRIRLLVLFSLVALLALALTACGGDDDEEAAPPETAPAETAASSGGDDAVAEATGIIDKGTSGVVYYPGPEREFDPAKAELLEPGDWRGPTDAPEYPESQKIIILTCIAGSACEVIGDAAGEAVKLLGWDAEVINADGTPAGYSQVFATAIAKKPDGIITVALPAGQVADKVAEAKAAGIKTVAAADIPPTGGLDGYDVYGTLLESIDAQLMAYWAIADSGGTAKVLYLWDYGFPHLVEAVDDSLAVMKKCGGCEVLEVHKFELATAADPVAYGKLTTSLIQKYGDDLEYIFTPYGFGVSAVIEATRAAGKSDIKVLSKSAYEQALGSVSKGEQAADFGTSLDWSGWAAVDQMVRLLSDAEPLEQWEEGMAVRVYVEENSPSDGIVDWSELVDFEAEYKKAWGVE